MNTRTPKVLTPYDQLFKALVDAGGHCISQVPCPKEFPHQFTFEAWSMPTPKPGRMVWVQRWHDERGSWDTYVPIESHKTDEAIAEVLNGDAVRAAADTVLKAATYEVGGKVLLPMEGIATGVPLMQAIEKLRIALKEPA